MNAWEPGLRQRRANRGSWHSVELEIFCILFDVVNI